MIGKNTQRGFWYSNVANATIKWEDVAQWNIGVDASFLDNRLNTTIEYYDKKTSDMLYSVGVPPSAGPSSEPFSETSSYRANIGKISNRGFWNGWFNGGIPIKISGMTWLLRCLPTRTKW